MVVFGFDRRSISRLVGLLPVVYTVELSAVSCCRPSCQRKPRYESTFDTHELHFHSVSSPNFSGRNLGLFRLLD